MATDVFLQWLEVVPSSGGSASRCEDFTVEVKNTHMALLLRENTEAPQFGSWSKRKQNIGFINFI